MPACRFDRVDVPQRSPEWFSARLGRLTGSRAGDMMATLKSNGEAAARRDLRLQLVCERLTNQPQDSPFINSDMQRGLDLEPLGRLAYEVQTGALVHTSGFLTHPELAAGCSLDGHLGDFEGIVELKAPRAATHLKYLRGRIVPPEYKWQVVHNLFITGADFCDFVSFCPQFPEPLRLVIIRVKRETLDLRAYELLVRMFLTEVDRECAEVAQLAAGVLVSA